MKMFTRFAMALMLAGVAGMAKAENLNVTEVQAANLDSYYSTVGQWRMIFVDGETITADVSVVTSGYNHIAGTFDVAGTDSHVYDAEGEAFAVTSGALTVEYVSAGEQYPVYHFTGSLVTEQETYTLDVTTEVFAYDYLYYLYYEMGYFSLEQILITLDDAPADGEHETYELVMTSGECTDYIASMNALQFTAENEDGLYMQVIVDADELVDGMTYELSGVYQVYCYLADLNLGLYTAYFKYGEVKLDVVADNTVSLEATLTAKGGDVYHILVPECHAEGVVYEGPNSIQQMSDVLRNLSSKKMVNGKIVIEHCGKEYGVNGASRY